MLDDRDYMRQPPRYGSGFGGHWRISFTVLLIVLNTVFFAMEWIASSNLRNTLFIQDDLALSLEGLRHGYVWQFLTFQFLHAGIWHLAFNCLTIFFFGRAVEMTLGRRRFLTLYLTSGILGGVVQMLFALALPKHFDAPVVGASAGAAGLVAAFAVLNWHDRFTLLLYFIPVNMRGRTLFWISVALAVAGILTPNSTIANAAHLGGILTGFLYVRRLLRGNQAQSEPVFRQSAPRQLVTRLKENKLWRSQTIPPAEDLTADEFLQKEVDPILDKISAHGIQSLTAHEREILEKARAKMAKR
jgi:membrane associated rhomboid family serine protease